MRLERAIFGIPILRMPNSPSRQNKDDPNQQLDARNPLYVPGSDVAPVR